MIHSSLGKATAAAAAFQRLGRLVRVVKPDLGHIGHDAAATNGHRDVTLRPNIQPEVLWRMSRRVRPYYGTSDRPFKLAAAAQ
jgi:hypothetical protein